MNEGIEKISSLEIVGLISSNRDNYLAVSSDKYPVIYIYNKNHEIVSRLVSHTMGVTCLKSFNFSLFSGSYDMTARLWDVATGVPSLLCNTRAVKITAIECGLYCDKLLLFVGGKNVVYCLSVTDKKALFEIILDDSMVARKIAFL